MLARHIAVVVCPSVRHEPVLYRNDRTNRAGFGTELPSTYHTLCYEEIWVSPKIRVLLSGTLFQTPDLENFATASRSSCEHNSSSSSSTVELVDDTYTTVRVAAVYYKSINCNRLTPLLRFAVDLLYNLF